MTTYYTNDIAFRLPDLPAVDRTLHVLDLCEDRRRTMTLMVARTPLVSGATLRGVVDAHLAQERRALRGWSLLFEREGEAAGRPMIEVATAWRGDHGRVYQRQAHLALPKVVLLFVGDAPFEARDACDMHVARALATLQLRP
jgi:hypothetical protein